MAADAIKTFTAPRGTVILCNTSGLHRGGFSTAKPRVLATATYCSPASLRALSRRNYTPAADALAAMSDACTLRGELVPLQQRPHRAAQRAPEISARAVSFGRVLDMERDDLVAAGLDGELGRTERADPGIDRDTAPR